MKSEGEKVVKFLMAAGLFLMGICGLVQFSIILNYFDVRDGC